jgi:DNA-binding NarL/FixJ family response regulator
VLGGRAVRSNGVPVDAPDNARNRQFRYTPVDQHRLRRLQDRPSENGESMRLRVAIAEDNYLMREALRKLVTSAPDLEVVAVCEDIGELIGAIERESPDVVMSDMRMPPFQEWDGIRVAAELRRTRPGVGVVILSQYADPALALELFESGSEGRAYLLKERVADRGQLVDAIQAVADGRSVVDAKIIDMLIAERNASSPLDELTASERQVLAEVAAGRSNGAIAASLFVTKRAVEKHINAIFMKLGLRDNEDTSGRVAAALIYLADPGSPSPRSTPEPPASVRTTCLSRYAGLARVPATRPRPPAKGRPSRSLSR